MVQLKTSDGYKADVSRRKRVQISRAIKDKIIETADGRKYNAFTSFVIRGKKARKKTQLP